MGGTPLAGRPGRVFGVATALFFGAVACTTGTPPGAGPTSEGGSSPSSGASSASAGGVDTGSTSLTTGEEKVETIEDLEAAWAQRRASVVASLSADPYGINDQGALIGPGQFSVDLRKCPVGWSDTSGVDAATIKIGITAPQSGNQAAFNEITIGMKAYFDWVNSRGGIEGRQIQLVVKDDGYDPALALAAIDQLITNDSPFYVTSVGSPGGLAVYDTLNANCIPQPFVASSHPAWGDPVKHPFTTGFQLSYETEAIMWGNWIKKNLADQVPVTVGALVIDNDFGQVYADSFQAWAAANRDIVSDVTFVRHDPAVASVATEMAQIAAAKPEVFVSMTAGDACLSAMEEAAKLGLSQTTMVMFIASGCKATSYMVPAGDAAEGFYAVGAGLRSTNDPAYAEDTFVKFAREQLAASGLDPSLELVGVGFAQYGWAHVEILRIANALPGGLTRSNELLALRGAELDHPMLLDGVRFSTAGNDDAYFVEGAEYSRYDSRVKAWFSQGPAADLNGTSPNCVWARSRCQR